MRLYVAKKLPGALVTPLTTPEREPAPLPSVANKFLDSEERVRVATRDTFIGRRRQLQNCLRELKKPSPESKIGVLIHSMGGLGKSTIASRLCDRLSEHKKIVWWRQIDESSLVAKIADLINNSAERAALKENKDELKYRLKRLFGNSNKLVLVFDDFEWNLEPRDGGYILKSNVAQVLSNLVWALENQENITEHRIIITCRYDFKSDLLKNFYKQPLEGLRKADLQKKLKQLPNFEFDENDNKKKLIVKRALALADGNPRLLEWLNDDVLSKENADSELSKFEASSKGWKEKIIWVKEDAPKLKIDSSIEKIVSRCLVFDISVPMPALEAVCDSISDYKEQLELAIKLGLIEVSPEPKEENRVDRVSRILPHIIPNIQLPEAPKVYSLYHNAHDKLHEIWGNKENRKEEKWREIFRLLFADKDNPERFRQGFSQMLSVQYNSEADRAFKFELRQLKDELSEENICAQLEDYLHQGDWRKADEETAWLFYLVMVRQGYSDWLELCQKFPSQTLNEIDRLWVNYSQGHFGFSIQKRIVENVGVNPNADLETWLKFCKQVEWYDEENGLWKEHNSLPFSIESLCGNLPALWIVTGELLEGWEWGRKGVWYWGEESGVYFMALGISLFSHQDLTYKV